MEIDSFLDHIVGAKDVLLVKINKKLNLGIPIEEIKLETDGRNDSNSDPDIACENTNATTFKTLRNSINSDNQSSLYTKGFKFESPTNGVQIHISMNVVKSEFCHNS